MCRIESLVSNELPQKKTHLVKKQAVGTVNLTIKHSGCQFEDKEGKAQFLFLIYMQNSKTK